MLLSSDDNLLLSVVCLAPTAQELERINTLLPQVMDWERVFDLLLKHGSAPLFQVKLPKLSNSTCVPSTIKTQLQQAYYRTLSRSMLLYAAYKEIVLALQQQDIELLVLKGVYLSECVYGDIALRQFSDIDLLVHEQDGLRSIEVLRTMGFVPWQTQGISEFVDAQSDFVHYKPMQRGEVMVEIHIKLHSPSSKYKLSIPAIWESSVICNIQNLPVRVMCTADLLMHLCVHADKHFAKGEIQLKCFNDLVQLLAQLPTDFNWDQFQNQCSMYQCSNVVFTYLVLVAVYYNAALPNELKTRYSPLLTASIHAQFINLLHAEVAVEPKPFSAVPGHINSLRGIKNPLVFARYVLEVLFPSKAFMMEKYLIPKLPPDKFGINGGGVKSYPLAVRGRYWWLWYGYRWWTGFRAFVKQCFCVNRD